MPNQEELYLRSFPNFLVWKIKLILIAYWNASQIVFLIECVTSLYRKQSIV